ncbi:MAG: DUF2029 domain-containing protein [Anaerolineales bacterium]|nr:DUF2029 domain-containing protein [Anaerolineales bacterium]
MNSQNTKTDSNHWVWIFVLTQSFIFAYYWFEWRTLENFVLAIDHNKNFLQDFIAHYYPMGKQILQSPTPVSGYFYTSFFALLLIPISVQTLPVAMIVWITIQIACLIIFGIVSARGLLKLSPLSLVIYFALLITSFPVLHNFKWGQVSLLIMVCVLSAFLLYKKDKKILAAILLGIATSIKLYPAYFAIYFILKRDIRASISFGLSAFMFYFFLPATTIGLSNWLQFEKATNEAITSTGWIARDVNSQYITHVGSRWFEIIFNRPASESTTQALVIIGYILALSCIALVWLLQKNDSPENLTLSLITLFLIPPFILKTSWPHYFIYLPFCQIAILYYFSSTNHLSSTFNKLLYFLPILSIAFSSIFVFNLFDGWFIYNQYGMLFLANLFLFFAILARTASNFFQKISKNFNLLN